MEPSLPAFFARDRMASSSGMISSLGYRLGTCVKMKYLLTWCIQFQTLQWQSNVSTRLLDLTQPEVLEAFSNPFQTFSSWRTSAQKLNFMKMTRRDDKGACSHTNNVNHTSPVLRILLISSRNCSILSCVSLNKNTVGVLSAPDFFKTSWSNRYPHSYTKLEMKSIIGATSCFNGCLTPQYSTQDWLQLHQDAGFS